jgi:hypothetical protein
MDVHPQRDFLPKHVFDRQRESPNTVTEKTLKIVKSEKTVCARPQYRPDRSSHMCSPIQNVEMHWQGLGSMS